ncbi:MAG: 1-acyl-sn-glycerol-3-phosphate acyltransferase [Ruminococcaceae bacterium]|nr:1-acyl-sn-glycerol-3-phosphate acyltransferase [Oscillospiraceae bacterium]
MIIGDKRKEVIENIKTAIAKEDFYAKVEVNDPVLTPEEGKTITNGFLSRRKKLSSKLKSFFARRIANVATKILNRDTEIIGEEKFRELSRGAIITSNHFSPIENTVVRKLVLKNGHRRLNVVAQLTNFAMKGIIGFLMNYADTIPLAEDFRYLNRDFLDVIKEKTDKGETVLIYPEQEMWFNYRKPRPPKRGPYYFAAKLNVPVVCCFVEMRETEKKENDEFNKVKYILHVLDILYPNPEKSDKENSTAMAKRDFELKIAAYENAYNKKLSYEFEKGDIAGCI